MGSYRDRGCLRSRSRGSGCRRGSTLLIVEIIAVGTELLLGQIGNTNATHIASRLTESGLDCTHRQVVGDNLNRLSDVIRTALGRSDAVILTGGLGPTRDDLTREAISDATGRPLLRSEAYVAALRERYETMGSEMPLSNLQQADYPDGAEMLPNPRGSAPGLVLDHDGVLVFALPGVPPEMELLLEDHVLPRLADVAGGNGVLLSRVLHTWGLGESRVGELLDDRFEESVNPSIAFLASAGETKVRLTAKAEDEEAALRLIEPLEGEVRDRLGSAVFATDGESIESVLHRLLRERGWTLGTAESLTGGSVGARITSVAGASDVFRGAIVAYHTDVKERLLSVGDLSDGVVSEKTALAMARGAIVALGVDVAVSLTGEAGPTSQEQPPGTVVMAVVTPEEGRSRTFRFLGDRERVRAFATSRALHLCRLAVSGVWWDGQ
ncbi:MAG: competence/damage-inducible protein A [Acidimicrobiia bacterium]|nr:competence/damage-inducible protein A [Acidimicrobiia bacterium]